MDKDTDQITKDEMRNALRRSGYLIETRVATALRDCEWLFESNPAYVDSEGAKSRELDLHAFKDWGPFRGLLSQYFSAQLLIECVNNPVPVAVITSAQRHSPALLMAGCPQRTFDSFEGVIHEDRLFPIEYMLRSGDSHRYDDPDIPSATQYCSFTRKKGGDWMATHTEDHHISAQALSDAAQHFTDRYYVQMAQHRLAPAYTGLTFIYPILVLGGELFAAHAREDGDVDLKAIQHAILTTSSYRRGSLNYCSIDIVTESALRGLLARIDHEQRTSYDAMFSRRDVIEASVTHLLKYAPDIDNAPPGEIRRYFEGRPD